MGNFSNTVQVRSIAATNHRGPLLVARREDDRVRRRGAI